ncbi:hypothetical protein F66182_3274 [Fusarium sp. NRRL 66182]|nr:hypothetical protein F66182_3274 [Fusarium sp. NRRL 66182]
MSPMLTDSSNNGHLTTLTPEFSKSSKHTNGSSTEYSSRVTADVVSFVREHSPFYKSTLGHLPPNTPLSEIPLTDADEFWKQASAQDTSVLTGPFVDGLVMRSAGSTSEPKIVYWTRDEFHRILSKKAEIMSRESGIIPGDRIANLSHMGGMYGGFMFTNQALMEMPTDNVHLPISGQMPHDFMADNIDKFKATVMISTVYATTKLASWLQEQGRTLPSIRLIFFMGEAFFKDVRHHWLKSFPNALIGPYIYGSVECGPVALPAHAPRAGENDDSDPLYKVIREVVYMEIVDEKGVAITQPGVRGTVVVTHLLKKLQPAIRYPIGDVAAWEDYAKGTFKLYGRESVALKISNAHLDLPLLKSLIAKHISPSAVFQSVVRRTGGKNVLIFRVVREKPDNADAITAAIEADIAAVSNGWVWNKEAGMIGDLEVEYVDHSQLVVTPGSGKLKNFVEERYE